MNQARVLDLHDARDDRGRERMPDVYGRAQGNGRELFASKLEELAAKIRTGELDGCRAQWRDDNGPETEMVTVTLDSAKVQLVTTTIEED